MTTEVAKSQIKDLVLEYLGQAKMMQLATSVNGQPWCCNVWFGSDDDLNIYWFSSLTRRHSVEVLENPKVAGAIVLPLTPNDVPRGLQFEGIVEKLTVETDIARAKRHYVGRIFPSEIVADLMASPTKPHAFYRIRPSLFVLFDALNFPENSRQEYRVGQ